MRLGDVGEFGLIAKLRFTLEKDWDNLVMGVGDDAAVFRSCGEKLWAFAVDAMVEGVHFDPEYVPWHALGYKALAINLSDLAAMGGCSFSFALVNLGLAGDIEVEAVEEMYRGSKECGEAFSCAVVGGDMVRSPGAMFVSVAVVGAMHGDRFLRRDGARPGQAVLVTGSLGSSYLGLRWLMEGRGGDNRCAQRHLYPQPRLEEGREALALGATAAIDISDGLLRDLGHICEESGVGAEIFLHRLPLSEEAVETGRELGEDPFLAALHGGEDYELILTADERDVPMLEEELGVTVIGGITSGKGIRVLDSSGKELSMKESGYEHFRED